MAEDAERRARLCLSCTVDGGDPAVVELVGRHGPEGAWTRIRGGALGEPMAQRAVRLCLASVERLATEAGARFVVPGDEEWAPGLADLAHAGEIQRRGGEPYGL
jgi:DNA processing protein